MVFLFKQLATGSAQCYCIDRTFYHPFKFLILFVVENCLYKIKFTSFQISSLTFLHQIMTMSTTELVRLETFTVAVKQGPRKHSTSHKSEWLGILNILLQLRVKVSDRIQM